MQEQDYVALTATEIAARVQSGELSAREAVSAALSRIEATEPKANAFIHLDKENALAEAERVDADRASGKDLGPLAGVPVSVKDLVHVAGMPTSSGSAVFAGKQAPEDAAPVARLRAADAVIVGKTTTPEFGHKPFTESPLFGRTLNPWNTDYTSGGSSGGAAVSVALRQVPLAIGTDGGGSVRIPASICGTYGLKATQGRIPHVHSADLFGNNSYIGPMTANLEDLKLMYSVMAGPDSRDPWAKVLADAVVPPKPLRIGFALKVGNPAIEEEVAVAVKKAAAELEQQGAEIETIDVNFARYEPGFRVHLESALMARVGSHLDSERERFDPSFVQTMENGRARSGIDVQNAMSERTALYRELERLFEKFDVLLTPTLAAASLSADTDSHADVEIAGVNAGAIRAGWYPYTFPMNLTGHPAISVPCGWTSQGLPIGLQLAGRWYEEETLLNLANDLHRGLGSFQRAASY
ncbi:amidase [Fodinicurvata halophila]|uniref:Amidase n=1 Tax=Fodinicurvata halophila TaxID=1419723 RepID=A0ABV8UGE1_9PROT